MQPSIRIQIQLDEGGQEIIRKIRKATKEDMSYRELFENALAFLYWGVQQRQNHRKVASVDEAKEQYREVVMPLFEWVKEEPQAKTMQAGA